MGIFIYLFIFGGPVTEKNVHLNESFDLENTTGLAFLSLMQFFLN